MLCQRRKMLYNCDMKITVLCLGESVHRYEISTDTTIGVNDVNKYFPDTPVDYIVCMDKPDSFTPERLHTIRHGWCKKFFTPHEHWADHYRYEKIQLGRGRRNLKELDDPNRVVYSNNSAFVATVMAYRMGAKVINIYGADFINHPGFVGRSFHLAMEDFRGLYKMLKDRGVEVYVTKESALSLFIPSF